MEAKNSNAIREKCDSIFSKTLGVIDLIRRYNWDDTLVYVYDRRDGRKVLEGTPEEVLDRLAEIETAVTTLEGIGYRVHKLGDQ